jgi:hypothetical protein
MEISWLLSYGRQLGNYYSIERFLTLRNFSSHAPREPERNQSSPVHVFFSVADETSVGPVSVLGATEARHVEPHAERRSFPAPAIRLRAFSR